MEQVLDWLNENELRAYPLLDSYNNRVFDCAGASWQLPDNFLLDLQLIDTVHKHETPIALQTISRSTLGVELAFGSEDYTVESFFISSADILAEAFPKYVRKPGGSLAVFGRGLLEFLIVCATNDVFLSPNIPVEPSVFTEYNGAWLGVASLKVSPEKISKADSYVSDLPLSDSPQQTTLTGNIRLLEGYNFNVLIENDLINLAVDKSYGLPMDCSTSFLQEEYLDCTQIISYINGIPPDDLGNFTINPGDNINITQGSLISGFNDAFSEQSNAHSLFIGLSFNASDICAPVNITPSLL